jgi:hypothetical protein
MILISIPFIYNGFIMKKTILATALLLSLSHSANAGLFDAVVESAEELTATATKTESVVSAKETAAATNSSSLLATLTDQLGVTDSQAEGGLGSLMQLAQSNLSTQDFSQISSSIPNMDSLLAAVPEIDSSSASGVTNLLANSGDLASSLGGLSLLTEQFEALGLSSDMVSQFANIAISYFSEGGDSTVSDLLQKGLSAL